MPKPGPRTTYKYSEEFKATAVRLSQMPSVEVQAVAASLYIHPFMLSLWRKQAREGLIVTKGIETDRAVAAELAELRKLKKKYRQLQMEHDLLKKPSRSLPLERRHLRLRRAQPSRVPGKDHVPALRRQRLGLLCLVSQEAERQGTGR